MQNEIKLFVGAICELKNGNIDTILSFIHGMSSYRGDLSLYGKDGIPPDKDDVASGYYVTKILNPKDAEKWK